MLDVLVLVISTPSLRGLISQKLQPFFNESYVTPSYERANVWLSASLPGCVPDVTIIEWQQEQIDQMSSLYQSMLMHLASRKILVIVRDPPEPPVDLKGFYQVRVVSRRRLMECDLPSWLGLADLDHLVPAGRLVLKPARGEVTIISGPDADQWPTIKLSSPLRTRTLEFLMRHARGPNQAKKAEEILDAVWLGRGKDDHDFFDPKAVQSIIKEIRGQIEPDPKNPTFLKSRRGRGKNSGYYIDDNEDEQQ